MLTNINNLFQKYVKSIRLRPIKPSIAANLLFQKYVKSIRLRPDITWIKRKN